MAKRSDSKSSKQALMIFLLLTVLLSVVIINITLNHFFSLEPRAKIVVNNYNEVHFNGPNSDDLILTGTSLSPGDVLERSISINSSSLYFDERKGTFVFGRRNDDGFIRIRAEFSINGVPTNFITLDTSEYASDWTKGDEWNYFNNALVASRRQELNFNIVISNSIPAQELLYRISVVLHLDVRSTQNNVHEIWGEDVPDEWLLQYEPTLDITEQEIIDAKILFSSEKIFDYQKNYIDYTQQGFATYRNISIDLDKNNLQGRSLYFQPLFKKSIEQGLEQADEIGVEIQNNNEENSMYWKEVDDEASDFFGWYEFNYQDFGDIDEDSFDLLLKISVVQSFYPYTSPPFSIEFMLDIV